MERIDNAILVAQLQTDRPIADPAQQSKGTKVIRRVDILDLALRLAQPLG